VEAVWVFNGDGGSFPSAIFSTREAAQSWIAGHRLSGCLTRYPLDRPLYEWAIDSGHFEPRFPSQQAALFIQRFSSAYLEHYHFEAGIGASDEVSTRLSCARKSLGKGEATAETFRCTGLPGRCR
jgi:hypothetical protein